MPWRTTVRLGMVPTALLGIWLASAASAESVYTCLGAAATILGTEGPDDLRGTEGPT